MNKQAVQKIARQHQVFDPSLDKAALIRRIQLAEGNFDCYGKAGGGACDQGECLWRKDCLLETGSAATTH